MPVDEKNRCDMSPGDPMYRWKGVNVMAEKSADSAIRERQGLFATVEEFGEWRKSKGMPPLDHWNLAWAWAKFKGEPVTERAVANPILEHR
jgi:hypothetical protein